MTQVRACQRYRMPPALSVSSRRAGAVPGWLAWLGSAQLQGGAHAETLISCPLIFQSPFTPDGKIRSVSGQLIATRKSKCGCVYRYEGCNWIRYS